MKLLPSFIAGLLLASVAGAAPLCPPVASCAPQATCCCASDDAPEAGCCTLSTETPAPPAALAPASHTTSLVAAPVAASTNAASPNSTPHLFSSDLPSFVAPLPGADTARAPPVA